MKHFTPGKREAFRNANEAWRRDNVGRAIFEAAKTFEREVLNVLQSQDFHEVRMVNLNLFRNLDLDGTRLTELASRANVTKQAMQELVDRAEAQGFVVRLPDPKDGRAKAVAFSTRGLKLLEALHKAVMLTEQQMTNVVGVVAVRQIATALRQYNSARNK